MKKSLGIYKIPPLWDRNIIINSEKIDYKELDKINNFNEHKTRKTSINDNIYFNIYRKIVLNKNYDENNYIFIDEHIEENLKFKIDNINIYIIKDYKSLCYFKDAELYFLRGCYFNFYNQIITNDNSKIIFYPAVSFQYNYYKNNIKLNSNISFYIDEVFTNLKFDINHSFLKKINICLTHENELYNKIFKYSKNINFFKFSSEIFNYLNLDRIYDYIYVADSTQYTKNHELFFNFINYCEKNKLNINILYISNFINLSNIYKNNFINPNLLNYVNLEYHYNLSPQELNILFNKSKINIILSNRDSCPRIISESLASGCYNIILDLLSDGKNYIEKDNILGDILNLKNILKVKISKSNSLIYVYEDILSETILKYKNYNYDHELISKKSIELFNIKQLYNDIKDFI